MESIWQNRASNASGSDAVSSANFASSTISSLKEPGAAQKAQGISVGSFLAALGSGSVIFLVQVSLFLLLRQRVPRIYQPKSYLAPDGRRVDPPPHGFFQLIARLWNVGDVQIIRECGLDAYFFLRYLKTLLVIFLPICGVVVPILTPLNFIGGKSQQVTLKSSAEDGLQVAGLDALAWSNINPRNTGRYAVHLGMAVLAVAWTCVVFFFELRVYVKVRQDYLTSVDHRLRASATTILVCSIPSRWLSEDALRGLFDVFPGGVKNIWLNRDLSELLGKISYRDRIHMMLESAETALIRAAKRAQLQRIAAGTHEAREDFKVVDVAAGAKRSCHQLPLQSVTGGANSRIGGVLGTTNGFVHLKGQGNTTGTSHTRSTSTAAIQPQNTHFLLRANAVRTLLRDSSPLEQETTAWWQFWKTPTGSFPPPIPRGSHNVDHPSQPLWKRLRRKTNKVDGEQDPEYPKVPYPSPDQVDADASWKKYLRKKDRPTHRLSPFGITWLPGLPVFSQEVDTIRWCREHLDRLNREIEVDQSHPERFPLMNSAFIQFHRQVAAHMACQSEIYHLPQYMAPRMVEIAPQDVIWSNLALPWWEEWIRMTATIGIVFTMILLWSIPVAWTAVLGQLGQLVQNTQALLLLVENEAMANLLKVVSGVMPTILLTLLLVLVPLILNFLAELKGVKTGAQRAEFVQTFYFCFLFIQVFLVISIASFFAASLSQLLNNVRKLHNVNDLLDLLATNLPKGSNYFFAYMILQGLSVSSGTLVQSSGLIAWYVLAPLFDATARSKWSRNTRLHKVQWGTCFPVYTNLACICLVYCVIAPLISIFAVIAFGLLWLAQRYVVLYVAEFGLDTGGILYPRAINQTFTGLYVMELCLAGMFFLIEDQHGKKTCTVHGIVMLLVFGATAVYQLLLNMSFYPLFRHLPISLEDEAVLREEAFDRAQQHRGSGGVSNHQSRGCMSITTPQRDITNALYTNTKIEMMQLSPDECKYPVSQAFMHEALRNRPPTVWIPGDDTGVSDDEVRQTTGFYGRIAISNAGAGLDDKARVVYSQNPPDYLQVDEVNL
ncbi:hypothetical protein B0T10DRAFT_296319 [Thelonectria olida]|uniref:DUF221-domain-containing protein n=1 Tax=Thelonectria olida TaxID=1576542 RepID=A0A9P8VPC9_9HYPO|nr:hypothetical protein B0T10DRAFT_296319 [Thelonectria olida]